MFNNIEDQTSMKISSSMSALNLSEPFECNSHRSTPNGRIKRSLFGSFRVKTNTERSTFVDLISQDPNESLGSLFTCSTYEYDWSYQPTYVKMMNDTHLIDDCNAAKQEIEFVYEQSPMKRGSFTVLQKPMNNIPGTVNADQFMSWIIYMEKYLNAFSPSLFEIQNMDFPNRNALLKEQSELRQYIASHSNIINKVVQERNDQRGQYLRKKYLELLLGAIEKQCLLEGIPGESKVKTSNYTNGVKLDVYKLSNIDIKPNHYYPQSKQSFANSELTIVTSDDGIYFPSNPITSKSSLFSDCDYSPFSSEPEFQLQNEEILVQKLNDIGINDIPHYSQQASKTSTLSIPQSTLKLIRDVDLLIQPTNIDEHFIANQKVDKWLLNNSKTEKGINAEVTSETGGEAKRERNAVLKSERNVVAKSERDAEAKGEINVEARSGSDTEVKHERDAKVRSESDAEANAERDSEKKAAFMLNEKVDNWLLNNSKTEMEINAEKTSKRIAEIKSEGDVEIKSKIDVEAKSEKDVEAKSVSDAEKKSSCSDLSESTIDSKFSVNQQWDYFQEMYSFHTPVSDVCKEEFLHFGKDFEEVMNSNCSCPSSQQSEEIKATTKDEPLVNKTETSSNSASLNSVNNRKRKRKEVPKSSCHKRLIVEKQPYDNSELARDILIMTENLRENYMNLQPRDFDGILKLCRENLGCLIVVLDKNNTSHQSMESVSSVGDDRIYIQENCRCGLIGRFIGRIVNFLYECGRSVRRSLIYIFLMKMLRGLYTTVKFFCERVRWYRSQYRYGKLYD